MLEEAFQLVIEHVDIFASEDLGYKCATRLNELNRDIESSYN